MFRNIRKGFTLLELLIVVVILAVLAGIALPQYLRTVAKSKEAEGWAILSSLRSSQMRYYAEYNKFRGGSMDSLDDPMDVDLPVNSSSFFNYSVDATAGTSFVATAQPHITKCAGCRTLTVDAAGVRTP